jgi:hypothetical protein
VIIYGVRSYGVVEAHGGEHAETQFFHIWFAPLIPTGSHWITDANARRGYSIGMHGKSVLAGYLRVWGPVVALATLAAGLGGNLPMLLVSALAIAATVWTWTWRNLRGEAAIRRSDFNVVAFGTRCEPRHMSKELIGAFKRGLDDRWNELKPERTPNEIARHGTPNPHEAVVAYGLLRVAGVMRGRAGRDEAADADRILEGAHSAPTVGEGPYREGVVQPQASGSVATLVRTMAGAQDAVRESPRELQAERLAQRRRRSRLQLVGLVLATPMILGGIALFIDSVTPAREVTLAELRSMHPPTSKVVRVRCDSVSPPLWEETDGHGDATHRITMCMLGEYLLPVRLDDDQSVPEHVVEGELFHVVDTAIWVEQGLKKEPELDARSLDVYVDSSDNNRVFKGIFGLVMALGVPVLWVLWFRARRRRLADAAALT